MKKIAIEGRRARRPAAAFVGTLCLGWLCLGVACPIPRASAAPAAPAGVESPAPLSLSQAVSRAGASAPGVSLAALRNTEAEARLRQARSIFFPSLSGSGSFVRQSMNADAFGISLPAAPGQPPLRRIGPFNLWDARGEAEQTLFSPSGWLRARAAARGASAGRAEMGTAKEDASARAAQAYVTAAQAEAALRARARELDLADQLVGVAEAQLKAGVATRLDMVRAETQFEEARSASELAQYQVTQSQIDLARALGLPPEERFTLSDTLDESLGRSSAPDSLPEVTALALRERPEVQAARDREAAASTAARAVWTERMGSLRLVANYGYNGASPDDWITTGVLSAQYSVPLFLGGSLEGRRHEELAQAEEASVMLADLEKQIAAEVQGALEALKSGRARQAIAAEQVRLAEEEEEEARSLFANGLAGNIEVIHAQTDLVRAHSGMIEAEAGTAQARVRLARAAGLAHSLR